MTTPQPDVFFPIPGKLTIARHANNYVRRLIRRAFGIVPIGVIVPNA